MAEIRRFYEELNKFWREEICHVVEALNKRRVDPKDFERWNSFRSSLKQTIEFWKVCFLPLLLCIPDRSNTLSRTDQQLKPYPATTHPHLQSVYSAFRLVFLSIDRMQGVDLGTIASSLSSTSGSFGEALDRMFSSDSLRYSPQLSRSSFQRVYVAFAANSDLCLSFLRDCAHYGEKVFTWCLSFNALPISSRVDAPHDLRERTARLLSEATGVSTENAASIKGLSLYEPIPVIPMTDGGGNFIFLLTRVATVQNDVQEGLGFRTEDYVGVKHSARESLVLGGSHRSSFR